MAYKDKKLFKKTRKEYVKNNREKIRKYQREYQRRKWARLRELEKKEKENEE